MTTFGGVRGLWQAVWRAGVGRGLTQAATLREGVAGGLATYRRTSMLADFREWSGVPLKEGAISAVRHDYRPSAHLFIETTGKQLRAFRYQVGVEVYNPETGERLHMTTNITSEHPMTVGDVLAEGLEPIKRSTEAYKSEITGYHLEAGFHREGETWD